MTAFLFSVSAWGMGLPSGGRQILVREVDGQVTCLSSEEWSSALIDSDEIARDLATGMTVAWVQGRWEMGPRALGHRSLLAEPFRKETRDRLNRMKSREGFRPVAPVCLQEDVGRHFEPGFSDPYMLYFQHVRDGRLAAVTHDDGSARVQTVTESGHPRLHALLVAFRALSGCGILCNTSLNSRGHGFVNRMSELLRLADQSGIDVLVVNERRFKRVRPRLGATS